MTFSNNLKQLMKETKTRQTQIAEQTGISQSTISAYITQSKEPTASKLTTIADYFNVSTDWLLDRTNNRYSHTVDYIVFDEEGNPIMTIETKPNRAEDQEVD